MEFKLIDVIDLMAGNQSVDTDLPFRRTDVFGDLSEERGGELAERGDAAKAKEKSIGA